MSTDVARAWLWIASPFPLLPIFISHLQPAKAELNKQTRAHLTPAYLSAELCCCSWQVVGSQGHTEGFYRSWHPAHIQPQTGVTNLLSASRDCAKTKGSAWDRTTLLCWSTDGMKVVCVTQGVKNVWLNNMCCQDLFSSSCQPVIVFWKSACSQENHFHQKQKPCLYFTFIFSYQVISLSNVITGILVELRNSQNFSLIT